MEIAAISHRKIDRLFPAERFIEQDPEAIYRTSLDTMREAVGLAGISASDIAGVGIANQRTSWVFWDVKTGQALRNLVTWQDSRGVLGMEMLAGNEAFNQVFPDTLSTKRPIYPPFGIHHIKETEPEFSKALERRDDVRYGNVDAWLLYKLTDGKQHATSYSTASNSIVYDTANLKWEMPVMEFMGVYEEMMPSVREESGDFGTLSADVLGVEIPILSMVADQQSAMFAQGCFGPDTAKCTNGTGTFVNVNIGPEFKQYGNFRTNVAWRLDEDVNYMCEGNSYTAGSCLEWASRHLELFNGVDDLEAYAARVPDSGGIYFVPALGGLSTAPYLDPSARASFMGIGAGTHKAHFVRAVLDSVAYAGVSLFQEMIRLGIGINKLSVSGGVSNSDFVVQLMANLLDMDVVRPHTIEATGLGAAELTALRLGWVKRDSIGDYIRVGAVFSPNRDCERDANHFEKWKKAVSRSLDWL